MAARERLRARRAKTPAPDEAAKAVAWKAAMGDGTKLVLNWKLAAGGGYYLLTRQR